MSSKETCEVSREQNIVIRVRKPLSCADVILYSDNCIAINGGCVSGCSRFWLQDGQSFPSFLAGLDMNYLGKKILGASFFATDIPGTIRNLRHAVSDLEGEDVGLELQWLDWLSAGEVSLDEYLRETTLENAHEYVSLKASPSWEVFWKYFWVPHVIPALKDIEAMGWKCEGASNAV